MTDRLTLLRPSIPSLGLEDERVIISSIAIEKIIDDGVSGPRHSCGFMPLSQFRHNRHIASHFTSGVTSECERYQQGINPGARVVQVRAVR